MFLLQAPIVYAGQHLFQQAWFKIVWGKALKPVVKKLIGKDTRPWEAIIKSIIDGFLKTNV